jgi:hexosaminidase
MIKNIFLISFFLFVQICFSQTSVTQLPLIPLPNTFSEASDSFSLSPFTQLVMIEQDYADEAKYLNNYLSQNFGFKLDVVNRIPEEANYIIITKPDINTGNKEAYQLLVNQNQIMIVAEKSEGAFYALQTLFQVFPNQKVKQFTLPCFAINDAPRYQWRGMHLDCSRHFFTKDEVKKYIDYLAMYKFNVFHWHLTDDQGWRIEIKKYPLLTEIGSKRKQTLIGKPSNDAKYDGIPYSGFYTQDEIKEVVTYAKSKHITIVPEIEMPGHSLAALAAYPNLACTSGPFESMTTWGVSEDVYCAGKNETFEFLQTVLDEVCDLFPSTYIHIGGDECMKNRWKECSNCKARMEKENLKDLNQLQSYFITRIEKYLNSKGKQIIGWDEILEGGLAPNAAVMSWRGIAGGIEAAKQKHNVVMTPGKPCYFDHYQSKDKTKEPLAIGGFNPLDSVYAYNPTPKSLTADEAKYILGAQANVWTEYLTHFSSVEYMSMPRMSALSEVLWTMPENKNYKNYLIRLKKHSLVLDKMKVNYRKQK